MIFMSYVSDLLIMLLSAVKRFIAYIYMPYNDHKTK